MDFDNRKVYGDTSITDGLVLFYIDPPGAGEHGLVASWLLLSHSWLCSSFQHVGLGLPGSFIFSHLYFTLGDETYILFNRGCFFLCHRPVPKQLHGRDDAGARYNTSCAVQVQCKLYMYGCISYMYGFVHLQ